MLDPESERIFDEHIRTKCKQLKCLACGGDEWLHGDPKILPVIESIKGTSAHETGGAPHVSLACANCGFVVLFSAQIVGLVGNARPSMN